MARLLSGPAIAAMVMHELWGPAMVTLAIAGASDWLDGYVARQWKQSSVLGSYLDPVADKVLICCTVGALAAEVIPNTHTHTHTHSHTLTERERERKRGQNYVHCTFQLMPSTAYLA